MLQQTRSILEELESMPRGGDSAHVIESRANNIMVSAMNLLDLINESYTESEADDLSRKLLNSIKNRDTGKFKRALSRINERKNNENKRSLI